MAGKPRFGTGGQLFAERAGPVVERGGELVGDRGARRRWCAGPR